MFNYFFPVHTNLNITMILYLQIYEKICDLTGESKNAHRLVKKPIRFNETRIPQFNKTLQAFINRTKEFPDYYDVLRMLEHCNRTYSLGLVNFEIKNIGEVIFCWLTKVPYILMHIIF